MVEVFARKKTLPRLPLTGLMDLEPAALQRWDKLFYGAGLTPDSPRLAVRESPAGRKQLLEKHKAFVKAMRQHVEHLQLYTREVMLFLLTDSRGVVLDMICDHETTSLLESSNVGIGTSFAMEHTGLNAVSVCMQTNRPVIVRAAEHHLKMFGGWTCLCAPVCAEGRTVGYLDMSFGAEVDIAFADLLLRQTVRRIEEELKDHCPAQHRLKVYELFAQFNLTPREKEVGYRWLINQTTVQIAAELFITEGTVRNMIKKVYAKVGVNGKGGFMNRFLAKVQN